MIILKIYLIIALIFFVMGVVSTLYASKGGVSDWIATVSMAAFWPVTVYEIVLVLHGY